ncbi:MAG: hypothetical protein ABIA83_01645 [Patescibacteria group bacterium]
MKKTLFISTGAVLSLVLLGAGCLSSSSTSATGGVWQTTDNGGNWTQLASLPQASGVGSIAGVNITDIEIDPEDATVYYLATDGNGIFYSYDAGTTWQRPDAVEGQSGTILDIEVDPRNVCTVYVATPSNIMKTTDCMRSFSVIYKIDQADEYLLSFDIDWYNPNILWFGNKQGAVGKSDNAGSTWSVVTRVNDEVNDVQVSKADSRIIYVATDSKGFFRSTDSGTTWIEFEDDLKKQFKKSDEVYGFAQTEDGTSVIMNTQYGLLISVDNGQTWNALSLITAEGEVRIWDVAFAPHNASAIYYTTASTFYSTSTGGQSWVTESLPTSRTPYVIDVNPKDMGRVLVGFRAMDK